MLEKNEVEKIIELEKELDDIGEPGSQPKVFYDTLEDAYAVIAKSDKPLAAYIYSNKKSEVDMFMAKVFF